MTERSPRDALAAATTQWMRGQPPCSVHTRPNPRRSRNLCRSPSAGSTTAAEPTSRVLVERRRRRVARAGSALDGMASSLAARYLRGGGAEFHHPDDERPSRARWLHMFVAYGFGVVPGIDSRGRHHARPAGRASAVFMDIGAGDIQGGGRCGTGRRLHRIDQTQDSFVSGDLVLVDDGEGLRILSRAGHTSP